MWEVAAAGLHDYGNVTSERRIALPPTLIRWWEWLRAVEVKRWQERDHGWAVTDGHIGGAERNCLGNAVRTGKLWLQCVRHGPGSDHAGALFCPRHLSASVSPLCGRGERTPISPSEFCGCFAVTSSSNGGFSFEECVPEPFQIITAILIGSKWSCSLHDITACLEGRNLDLPEMVEKFLFF